MNYFFRSIIILFGLIAGPQLQAQTTDFSLYVPSDFPAEVSKDLIQLLNSSQQHNWRTVSGQADVNRGIILKLSDESSFKTKESFHLQTNGSSLLIISSSSVEGLEFGIYKYLRTLGYKFYLPDDLYTIVPKKIDLFAPKKNYIDQPFAQIRNFFGTGGFGSGNSDTDKTVEKKWTLWKLRNGFGAAYELGGHRGEVFILENNDVLLKHLDWLIHPKVTNGKIDPGTKLNYNNKDAVDFLTSWSLKPFTRPDYKLPNANVTQFVSMEPSDGGGYSMEDNKPSVSDQVFKAANEAASKLDKLFPNHRNIGVNLYAYSSHAEPPTFQLNPRVFVQIIPYQFQNIAFGPSFIQMWAAKTKRFGIYDYFKYPDQQFDAPGGITLQEIMQRLIYSVKKGSEGTTFETSYSKFSTGIPLWIISRYLADGESDWQKNLDLLTNDLYQQARLPIKKMFSLFYNDAVFGTNNLADAVLLADTASQQATDPLIQQRLTELKEYLFFTHLVFASRDISKTSMKDRLLPLSQYAWKIYESGIVDSYRIMQLVSYNFLNMSKSESDYPEHQRLHLAWFPETDRKSAAWSSLPQSTSQKEVNNNFSFLQHLYNKPSPNFSYSLAQIKNIIFKTYKPIREMNIGSNYTVRSYFSVYCEKPSKIRIKYTLINARGNGKLVISGIDKNYTTPITFTLDKQTGSIEFNLPVGETSFFMNASDFTTYRFNVNLSDGLFFFNSSPRAIVNFYRNFSDDVNQNTYNAQVYPSYIFIPEGIKQIQYKVQLNSLQIFSSSGQKINSKLLTTEYGGTETRELEVPRGETDKIWQVMVGGNFDYNFINIPDRYFLLEKK